MTVDVSESDVVVTVGVAAAGVETVVAAVTDTLRLLRPRFVVVVTSEAEVVLCRLRFSGHLL